MKRVIWEDMGKYGITIVTGEACGLSMRLLVEINEQAWPHVQSFFGWRDVPPNPFVTNGYSSIMIPNTHIPLLLVYLVLMQEKGVQEILYVPEQKATVDGWSAMYIYVPESLDDSHYAKTVEAYRKSALVSRFYRKQGDERGGARQKHWFTGMVD
jgi:hypothetical protein